MYIQPRLMKWWTPMTQTKLASVRFSSFIFSMCYTRMKCIRPDSSTEPNRLNEFWVSGFQNFLMVMVIFAMDCWLRWMNTKTKRNVTMAVDNVKSLAVICFQQLKSIKLKHEESMVNLVDEWISVGYLHSQLIHCKALYKWWRKNMMHRFNYWHLLWSRRHIIEHSQERWPLKIGHWNLHLLQI